MKLSELEATNAATLSAIREGRADEGRPDLFPFFGFYEVDIFESPPFVMFTSNDCPRALNIMFAKNFEMTSMKVWCRLARKATSILDIGAHVGVYSLAAASLRKDISVHAFEPNPHAYTRLRMHKIINGFTHIVEHPIAVGDQNGYVNFGWTTKAISQISSGGHVVGQGEKTADGVLATMRSLDGTELVKAIGNHGLIKVDVEGGEATAFAGMGKLLVQTPDIILESFSSQNCDLINQRILPLGYKVYLVVEEEGRLEPRDKLMPCNPATKNYNQFLSARPAAEVMAILN